MTSYSTTYLAYYTVGTKVIKEPVRFDVPREYQGFATAWLHDHDLLPKNGVLYRLVMGE